MMRTVGAFVLATLLAASPVWACESAQTQVSEVYPTGPELPENLLRFYVYFSAPMGQGDILDHVELLDEAGNALPDVFLPSRYELWSSDRTRLTVLLDPGRVKTGLVANRALGRALVSGAKYSLRISSGVRDENNCPLLADHVKSFTAVTADVASPLPENWELALPTAGTRAPLTIQLDGSVDHISLAYRIRVIGPDGDVIGGSIELGAAETHWHFKPTQPWQAATYQVSVDPLLEDLAGNRMDAVFDLDLTTAERPSTAAAAQYIAFVPQ
ncbi:MAG: hypothetical protein AAFR39_14395 [Pseudomonadota bacterium]